MPKYTITYFPLSGRALAPRLMFTVAGVEFEDVRIPFAEWGKVKADEARFPLGQMPTLEVDGKVICQSGAIYRYLANELGFYGDSNTDKAEIDQLCETLIDYFTDIMKLMFDKSLNEEQKIAKYDEYFASAPCLKRLSFITNILKRHGEKFFIGEKLSLADFVLLMQNAMLEPKYPTYLDKHPELKALLERIKSVESIKKYLAEQK